MRRISEKFEQIKQQRRKALIIYVTAGDPDLETTGQLLLEFEKRGVDLVELGVPFSDPLADGPIIQAASERALRCGTSLSKILAFVKGIRRRCNIPLVLFTYYNPVYRMGVERFVLETRKSGIDGVLITDLPPEEVGNYKILMEAASLDTIFLIAPTSKDDRIKLITEYSSGFVYYISRTGVTGERDSIAESVQPMVEQIRRFTDKPICVGFGISNSQQVTEVAQFADGVVVGSAVVRRIAQFEHDPNIVEKIGSFIEALRGGLNGNADKY